jgi:hypothetical protein
VARRGDARPARARARPARAQPHPSGARSPSAEHGTAASAVPARAVHVPAARVPAALAAARRGTGSPGSTSSLRPASSRPAGPLDRAGPRAWLLRAASRVSGAPVRVLATQPPAAPAAAGPRQRAGHSQHHALCRSRSSRCRARNACPGVCSGAAVPRALRSRHERERGPRRLGRAPGVRPPHFVRPRGGRRAERAPGAGDAARAVTARCLHARQRAAAAELIERCRVSAHWWRGPAVQPTAA